MSTPRASNGPGEADASAPGSRRPVAPAGSIDASAPEGCDASTTPYGNADARALESVARLLGHLLLHELDRATWEELQEPEVRAAVAAIGLELPADPGRETLDVLAAEYLRTFLQPESGGPLVQSLWTEGTYEGRAAVAVRQLAEDAGATFDPAAARGAPHDHLGCLLLLWATLHEHAPSHAAHLVEHHLRWSLAPLDHLARSQGYCASLARATQAFVRELVDDPSS